MTVLMGCLPQESRLSSQKPDSTQNEAWSLNFWGGKKSRRVSVR